MPIYNLHSHFHMIHKTEVTKKLIDDQLFAFIKIWKDFLSIIDIRSSKL